MFKPLFNPPRDEVHDAVICLIWICPATAEQHGKKEAAAATLDNTACRRCIYNKLVYMALQYWIVSFKILMSKSLLPVHSQ